MKSFRIFQKKGQAILELAICCTVFMVCVFGAFDLVLMQVGLLDTMTLARDTLRATSLTKPKSAREGAMAKKQIKEEAVKFYNAMASGINGNKKHSFLIPSKATVQGKQGEVNIDVGNNVHNAPVLAQVCTKVNLMVPQMWTKNGKSINKVCASYFMLRQLGEKTQRG